MRDQVGLEVSRHIRGQEQSHGIRDGIGVPYLSWNGPVSCERGTRAQAGEDSQEAHGDKKASPKNCQHPPVPAPGRGLVPGRGPCADSYT